MEALLGQPGYEFIPQLQEVGAIFLNPDSGSWETADTYLAGNVRQKLMFAENAGRKFASNVEALKAVIPDDLAPHENWCTDWVCLDTGNGLPGIPG
jgi:N12 class adenine-specific DNA methylase